MRIAYGKPNLNISRSRPRLVTSSSYRVYFARPQTVSCCPSFLHLWKTALTDHGSLLLSPGRVRRNDFQIYIPKSSFQATSKNCSGLLCIERPICHLAYLGENLLHKCTCWLSKSSTTLSFSPVRGHLSIWSAELEEVLKKALWTLCIIWIQVGLPYIMRLKQDKPRGK